MLSIVDPIGIQFASAGFCERDPHACKIGREIELRDVCSRGRVEPEKSHEPVLRQIHQAGGDILFSHIPMAGPPHIRNDLLELLVVIADRVQAVDVED